MNTPAIVLGRTKAAPAGWARAAIVAWVVVAALGIGAVAAWPAPITEAASVPTVAVLRPVVVDTTAGTHGVMGQVRFSQAARTSAPSPERLDFVFDRPVEVLGVLVSVDQRGMEMMEVAAGVNVDAYGIDGDWMIHTSAVAGDPSIDESAWFPAPYALEAGDRVSVVAWLYNTRRDPYWVSPEVIVYYQSSGSLR